MDWFNDNWTFRKKITLTGQSGAGSNYQVLLKVGESSGASGDDFHVEGNSEVFPSGKNQGGDLRFTTDDGETLLDFWVEKVVGSTPNRTAYVWVKVGADLGTNKDIYIYYGNSEATNVSNGVNTFKDFSDFDGAGLDTGWSVVQVGDKTDHSIADSQLKLRAHTRSSTGEGTLVHADTTYNRNIAVMAKIDSIQTASQADYRASPVAIRQTSNVGNFGDDNEIKQRFRSHSPRIDDIFVRSSGSFTTETDFDFDVGKVHTTSWLTDEVKVFIDGALQQTITTNVPTVNNVIGAWIMIGFGSGAHSPEVNYFVDWIAVREYNSVEPSFNSAGDQEELFSGFISGTVTLQGSPIENAVVRCIKQSDNSILPLQTTDENGVFQFDDLEVNELYHLAVEYTDGDDLYNAPSLWDVQPMEDS